MESDRERRSRYGAVEAWVEEREREKGRKSQRRQKWESRTLQGIKSLFVTGTVMKILWLVKRGTERGERECLDSPTPGDLWNTNQPANTFAHAGAKLPGTSGPSAF